MNNNLRRDQFTKNLLSMTLTLITLIYLLKFDSLGIMKSIFSPIVYLFCSGVGLGCLTVILPLIIVIMVVVGVLVYLGYKTIIRLLINMMRK